MDPAARGPRRDHHRAAGRSWWPHDPAASEDL